MAGLAGTRGDGFMKAAERLFEAGSTVGLSEAELLDRFVGRRDEAAFAALVDRHGPMVLGVCRRLIPDSHEADDAFQAVFLILARKAGGIGRKELVGNWLYGVSRRVATRARMLAARRERTGASTALEADARRSDAPTAAETLARDETGERLHEEVGRLPERYRVPVVACYFEGKSCEEAAEMLRCPVGTVKGRLSRARDLLRRRLESRGVTVPAALLATALAAPELRAAVPVPPALAARAVRAGLAASSSPFAWMTAAVATASIRSLAEGVIREMFHAKLKSLAIPAGLVAAGLLAAGAGLAASQEAPAPKADSHEKPAAGNEVHAETSAHAPAPANGEAPGPNPNVKPPFGQPGSFPPGMPGGMGMMGGMPGGLGGMGAMGGMPGGLGGMGAMGGMSGMPGAPGAPGGMGMMGGMPGGPGGPGGMGAMGGMPGAPGGPGGMGAMGGMPGMPGGMPGMLGTMPDSVFIASASAFLASKSASGGDAAIHAALEEAVSVRLEGDSTLEGLLKKVREVKVDGGASLPVFVTRAARENAESPTGITLELEDVPLKGVMRLVLKDLELAYCVRDGIVVIGTAAEIRQELEEARADWLARNPGK